MSAGEDKQSVNTILQARARALARAPAPAAQDADLEVLLCRLGQETYGVETRHVREVVALKDLVPLPCTPDFVAGLVGVRGQILPVIDLERFLALPREGLTDLHRVVVVGGEDIEFGILVDMDLGVRTVAVAQLQTELTGFTGLSAQWLLGVTADRLIVLDMQRVIADPRLLVDEAAQAGIDGEPVDADI